MFIFRSKPPVKIEKQEEQTSFVVNLTLEAHKESNNKMSNKIKKT